MLHMEMLDAGLQEWGGIRVARCSSGLLLKYDVLLWGCTVTHDCLNAALHMRTSASVAISFCHKPENYLSAQKRSVFHSLHLVHFSSSIPVSFNLQKRAHTHTHARQHSEFDAQGVFCNRFK